MLGFDGRLIGGLLGVSLVLMAALASAQTAAGSTPTTRDDDARRQARTLGYAGVQAYERADYAAAERQLDKAFQLLQAPSLGLWSARAMARMGHLVEAAQRYLEVGWLPLEAGDEEVQRGAKTTAEHERTTLLASIPSVLMRLDGATWREVTVTVDGVALSPAALGSPVSVNPGRRVIVVSRGLELDRVTLDLKVGERRVATFRLSEGKPQRLAGTEEGDSAKDVLSVPATPVVSETSSVLPWVLIGTGSAVLGAGIVTGLLTLSKESELDAGCPNDDCPRGDEPGWQGRIDDAHRLASVTNVLWGVGLATAGVGITLLVLDDKERAPAQQTSRVEGGCFVGSCGLKVRGHF